MSNLSDFFATAAVAPTPQGGTNPHNQRAFTILNGGASYIRGYTYSHNGSFLHGNFETRGSAAYSSNIRLDHHSGGWNYSTVVGNDSQNPAVGAHGITMNSYLGNGIYDSLGEGGGGNAMSPAAYRYDLTLEAVRKMGCPIGLDQDYMLQLGVASGSTSATLQIAPKSMRGAVLLGRGYPSNAQNKCRLGTAGMVTVNTYFTPSGGISHNQSTGNMAILERLASSTSAAYRPVLCKNGPDPRKFINNNRAFETAMASAMAVSGNRVVGGDQNAGTTAREYGDTHVRMVLCDNNDVVVALKTIYSMQVHRWRYNSSSNSYNAAEVKESPNYQVFSQNYSPEISWCQTLDGKESVFYACRRYYAAGYDLIFLDHATGNTSRIFYGDSSNRSFSIVPYGASGFQLFNSENTDSGGLYSDYVNKRYWESAAQGTPVASTTDNFASGAYSTNALTGNDQWDVGYDGASYPTVIVHSQVDNKAIVAAESGE